MKFYPFDKKTTSLDKDVEKLEVVHTADENAEQYS